MKSADAIIIGAGHGGVECAVALRAKGFAGSIALLSDEQQLPYERPPLSKAMLAGTMDVERLRLRSEAIYAKNGIELALGRRIDRLDPAAGTATTTGGEVWAFRHCVIATGARARRLAQPDGPGVYSIRSIDDVLAMRTALQPGMRLLVLGGGYLGLEAACTAAGLGARVHVIEQAPVIMSGRVSDVTAGRMHALHLEKGVSISTGAMVASWERTDTAWRALTTDGAVHLADIVLVAIGATPNIEFAEAAGLACNGGILVDDACRSSAPNVFAIGDCAARMNPELGRAIRIESVNNALVQARTVAAVLTGNTPDARKAPTFWSEQCGRRLQMAGLALPGTPCEDVARDTARGWLVERYQHGVLCAVEAVDSPVEFMQAAKRISIQ
ncbi:MAG TPA: FAD-dependent oxidoreductase [Noviherbaspirillum sp.]|nr:FAD-dependent oxidoreductase [Noviherbaspirillum sp.]